MNREDQDFHQLRRLLKLKRYEQPPPRYFNDFSAQVVSRLKAAQASGAGDSWWQRLWAGFELRPAIPVALSAAVCGLLVLGAIYTETAQVPEALLQTPIARMAGNERPALGMAAIGMVGQPTPVELVASSTNFVPVTDSLFNHIDPYSFSRANHPLFK